MIRKLVKKLLKFKYLAKLFLPSNLAGIIILILGSDFGRITSVHVIEDKIPSFPVKVYMDELMLARFIDNSGVEKRVWLKVHDPKMAMPRIDHNKRKEKEIFNYCLKYGLVKTEYIGNALVHLIKAVDLENLLERLLKQGVTIY